MTASRAVSGVKKLVGEWAYSAVSIGVPAPVVHGHILHKPYHLGKGWVGFDFESSFGCPVKIINDAAMQALGGYHGGRMLFLGLGTGLGSAMIVEGVIQPMELAHSPYKKKTFEHYVGRSGLKRLGKKEWRHAVFDVIERLRAALEPDYVVVGGGNAKRLKDLPDGVETCPNDNAFTGGFRLWEQHALDNELSEQPNSPEHGRLLKNPGLPASLASDDIAATLPTQ